jgi:hypothetical protein
MGNHEQEQIYFCFSKYILYVQNSIMLAFV